MSGRRAILLEASLAPTLEAVDRVCADLRRDGFRDIPESERFAVELLLREALTNAVVHAGSACQVWCEVERLERGVAVRVRDCGEGFDWRRHLRGGSPAALESGRGVSILRQYSSALRFNEKGNQVEAVRVFQERSEDARF